MQPIVRQFTAAGNFIVPLNTYTRVGCAYSASLAVVVKPLANKGDITSVISTIASATGGSISYPADALLVTTTGATKFTVIQYGD